MGDALRDHEAVAASLEHERLNEAWMIDVRGRPQSEALPEWGFCPTFRLRSAPRSEFAAASTTRSEASTRTSPRPPRTWITAGGQLAAEIHFVPEAVVHYRMRRGLLGLWRQAYNYGLSNVLVYKKHRGLGLAPAPHPWRVGLRAWLGLGKRLLLAWSKPRFALFAWHLGMRMGMLKASVQHRVVLL